MDEVAAELFVGRDAALGDETRLRVHEITAIVLLTYAEPPDGIPSDVDLIRHPLTDGPQADRAIFEQAVTDVVAALQRGERVLVCCSASASRSPAVAATAFALTSDRDLDAALQQVMDRRPVVAPHRALVQHAAEIYTSVHTD